MELTFANTGYLWFLVSIPIFIIIHFFSNKYIRGRTLEFANFSALERVAKKPVVSKNITLLVIRMITLFLIILALAGTTAWYYGKSSEYDFVLAIDSSSSMLSQDFSPNRLDAAKKSALDFISRMPSKAKVGIISFAGTSFVEQKPTTNIREVRKSIEAIAPQQIGGTDIGGAMVTASNLFLEGKPGVVVLLTDGQFNVGLDIGDAINYANENHVLVNTIGIGTTEGGIFSELNVTLKLDETTLQRIANETGGTYYKAYDESSLAEAYEEIAITNRKKLSIDLSFVFMLIALILIFIDWSLINTKYITLP